MKERTLSQQIINRQTREQLEALPILVKDMVIESTPSPDGYYRDAVMAKVSAEMAKRPKDIFSPFSSIRCGKSGDKIKIRPVPLCKVYKGTE